MMKRIGIIVIFLMGIYALFCFNPLISTGGDSATYILLAKTFYSNQPMHYSLDGSGLNPTYPPVYPFLLFLVSLIFGINNIIAFKMLSVFAYIVQIIMFYKLTEFFTKSNVKRIFGLIAFSSLAIQIQLSSEILSESIFMMFLLFSVFYYIKYSSDNNRNLLIFSLVFALLSAFTREAGILLFVIYFTDVLIKKNYRALWFIVTAFLLSRVWSLILLINGVENIYYKQLLYKDWYDTSKGINNPIDLIIRYFKIFAPYSIALFNQILHSTSLAVNIITIIILLSITLVKFIKKSIGSFEVLYLAGTVLGVSLFPYTDIRYSVTTLFILILILISDNNKRKKKNHVNIYIFALSIMIINNSYVQLKFFTKENIEVIKKYDYSDFRNNTQFYPYEYQSYFDLARQIENEFDGASVFITRKPSLFTLFSNRDAVVFPFTDDPQILDSFFSNHVGHYLIYDQKNKEMRILENYIAINAKKFSMLYISHEDEIAIFEILP